MKLFLIIGFCLLFGIASAASAQKPENAGFSNAVGVEEIYLAKDDGQGSAGEAVESFLTSDVPIYCVVLLDSTNAAVVKMNFVAVSVRGVKPETKVLSVSYQTNGKQNRVNFTGRPDGAWIAGTYRIDIFVDNKLAGNRSFEIKKSPSSTAKPLPAVERLVPAKPAPKTPRRPRRN